MRQRNDTGHVQDVMAWPTEEHPELRPFTAAPGEVVDRPVLFSGFTLLDSPPADESELADSAQDASAADASEPSEPATAPETTARAGRGRAKSAAVAAEGSDA